MPKTALNPNDNAAFKSYKIFALLIIVKCYKTFIDNISKYNVSFGHTWIMVSNSIFKNYK